MDKKVLNGIISGIVEEIAKENELEEGEARALVGIFLRRNKDKLKSGALAPFLVTLDE